MNLVWTGAVYMVVHDIYIRPDQKEIIMVKEISEQEYVNRWNRGNAEAERNRLMQKEKRDARKRDELCQQADIIHQIVLERVMEVLPAVVAHQVSLQVAAREQEKLAAVGGMVAVFHSMGRISFMLLSRLVLLALWPFKLLMSDNIIIFIIWAVVTGVLVAVSRFLGLSH